MITLELVHLGGTKKTVEVVGHGHLPRLFIRWPLAGEYVLDVNRNYIQRNKQWKAADIVFARAVWIAMVKERRAHLIDIGVIKDYSTPSEYQAMMAIVSFLNKVYQS